MSKHSSTVWRQTFCTIKVKSSYTVTGIHTIMCHPSEAHNISVHCHGIPESSLGFPRLPFPHRSLFHGIPESSLGFPWFPSTHRSLFHGIPVSSLWFPSPCKSLFHGIPVSSLGFPSPHRSLFQSDFSNFNKYSKMKSTMQLSNTK